MENTIKITPYSFKDESRIVQYRKMVKVRLHDLKGKPIKRNEWTDYMCREGFLKRVKNGLFITRSFVKIIDDHAKMLYFLKFKRSK